MSPHHHFKRVASPYFASPHYEETKEAQIERKIEQKVEVFCNKLKYAFLWRLRRTKNG